MVFHSIHPPITSSFFLISKNNFRQIVVNEAEIFIEKKHAFYYSFFIKYALNSPLVSEYLNFSFKFVKLSVIILNLSKRVKFRKQKMENGKKNYYE